MHGNRTFAKIEYDRLEMAAAPERGGGHSPFMAKNGVTRKHLRKSATYKI